MIQNNPIHGNEAFRGVFDTLARRSTDPIVRRITEDAALLIQEQIRASIVLPDRSQVGTIFAESGPAATIVQRGKGLNIVLDGGQVLINFSTRDELREVYRRYTERQYIQIPVISVAQEMQTHQTSANNGLCNLAAEHRYYLRDLLLAGRTGTIIETSAGTADLDRLAFLHAACIAHGSRFIAHEIPFAASRIVKEHIHEDLPYITLPHSDQAFGALLKKAREAEPGALIVSMKNVLSCFGWREIQRIVKQCVEAGVDRVVATQTTLTSDKCPLCGAIKPLVRIQEPEFLWQLKQKALIDQRVMDDQVVITAAKIAVGLFASQLQSTMFYGALREAGYTVRGIHSTAHRTILRSQLHAQSAKKSGVEGHDSAISTTQSPYGLLFNNQPARDDGVNVSSTVFHHIAERNITTLGLPTSSPESGCQFTYRSVDSFEYTTTRALHELLLQGVQHRGESAPCNAISSRALQVGIKAGIDLAIQAVEGDVETQRWIEKHSAAYLNLKRQ